MAFVVVARSFTGFERGQPQHHPGTVPASGDAVVRHLDHERTVLTTDAHGHARGVRVLVGVADSLGQHRLGERLERGRDVPLATGRERHAQVRVHSREPLDLCDERGLRRPRGTAERTLERSAQVRSAS